MPKPVRAADVAERAGVSVTAVSFVFSSKSDGNIAPATRDRILKVAEELGYRPNKLAQSLRSRRTHALALMTDGIASSPFAGRLLAAAGQRAAELGQVLIVHDSHFQDEREPSALADLEARQVDAVVYATMGLRRLESAPVTTLPLVLANCYEDQDRHPSAVPDEASVGRLAVDLLTGAGHRRIVMLSGHGSKASTSAPGVGNVAGAMRARGFRAGMRSAGIERNAEEVRVGGWTISSGHAGAMSVLAGADGRLLPAAQRPTAIFAVNDRVATGVLLAALQLGLRVPADLSIVGVDDQEELADETVPALTTFRLPHVQLGTWAVDTAVALVGSRSDAAGAEQPTPSRVLFPFELVERDTVTRP